MSAMNTWIGGLPSTAIQRPLPQINDVSAQLREKIGAIVDSNHNTPKKTVFALALAFAHRAKESTDRGNGTRIACTAWISRKVSEEKSQILQEHVARKSMDTDTCEGGDERHEVQSVQRKANQEFAQRITLLQLSEFSHVSARPCRY
jgi:hypothetical protein